LARFSLSHETINDIIREYVRGGTHANTVEGYFAGLKRYHHVSAMHSKHYPSEFDFRYNERSKLGTADTEHAIRAVRAAVGWRLTYTRHDIGQG
jgi:hypothetical protein